MTQPLPPNPQSNPQQSSADQYGNPQTQQPYGTPGQGGSYQSGPYQGGQSGAGYQSPYNQGGYQQPPKTSGMTITALILGIASLFLAFIPVFGILVALAAVIVSGIALSKKLHSKGMSIAGLIMGILGLIGAVFATIMLFVGLAAVDQVMKDERLWEELEQELNNLEQPGSGSQQQGLDSDPLKQLQEGGNLPQEIRPGDPNQTVNPGDAEELLKQLEEKANDEFGQLFEEP